MSECLLSITAKSDSGAALPGAVLTFLRQPASVIGVGGAVRPADRQTVTCDGAGLASVSLLRGQRYVVITMTHAGQRSAEFVVPDAATADLATDALGAVSAEVFSQIEAAVLAATGIRTFATTGDGLAAVAAGEFFLVPNPGGGLDLYEDVAGVATLRGGILTGISSPLAAGSVGAPSLSFSGDSNLGLYRVAADILGIAALEVRGPGGWGSKVTNNWSSVAAVDDLNDDTPPSGLYYTASALNRPSGAGGMLVLHMRVGATLAYQVVFPVTGTELGSVIFRVKSTTWQAWREVGIRGSGTTASRPTLTTGESGSNFFDTTIGKPIWWTGTAWVDATGASV